MENEGTGGFLNLTDDERHELISGVLSNIDLSKAKRALEHAAKSQLVTDFVQFLTSFSLERALRGLILKAAEEGLQRYEQDRDTVERLAQQRDKFLSCFDAITSWPDNPEHRQVALTAVLSTFAIALHGQVPEDLIQGLRRDFTKPANKARRAEPVQEIIELQARNLAERKPETFINRRGKVNLRGTAAAILPAVTNDLIEFLKANPKAIPPKWRPVENPNEDAVEKAVNRIAGRLKRIKRIAK